MASLDEKIKEVLEKQERDNRRYNVLNKIVWTLNGATLTFLADLAIIHSCSGSMNSMIDYLNKFSSSDNAYLVILGIASIPEYLLLKTGAKVAFNKINQAIVKYRMRGEYKREKQSGNISANYTSYDNLPKGNIEINSSLKKRETEVATPSIFK